MKHTFTKTQANKVAKAALRTLTIGWTTALQQLNGEWSVVLEKRLNPADKQKALLMLGENGWHFWHPTTDTLTGYCSLSIEKGYPTPIQAIKAVHRRSRRVVNQYIKDLDLIKAENAV